MAHPSIRQHWSSLAALGCFIATANANPTYNGFGVWDGIFLNGGFHQDWFIFADIQNQVQKDSAASGKNLTLLEGGVGYRVLPSLSVLAAYGWTPRFSPYNGENRIWQQIQWTSPALGHAQFIIRTRFEERWIEPVTDTRIRLRQQIRAQTTGLEGPVGFAVSDELFVNFNGPTPGFDQNWVFLGPVFTVSPAARLEVGYLRADYRSPLVSTDNRIVAHAVSANVFLNF